MLFRQRCGGRCGQRRLRARAGDGALLFYTAHREGRPSIEDKAVAIADRDLTRFEKFAGNPVLPKPGPLDFCDRRVIRHAPTERWIMVTHGQPTGFYSSPDALTWQFESEFAATTPGLTPAPANR